MEQSGDIKWVGEWGIENMIRCQLDMLEKYPEMPMMFSLNLSTKQLVNVDLANNLIEIAKKYNINNLIIKHYNKLKKYKEKTITL